jgi:hypothetical protein
VLGLHLPLKGPATTPEASVGSTTPAPIVTVPPFSVRTTRYSK